MKKYATIIIVFCVVGCASSQPSVPAKAASSYDAAKQKASDAYEQSRIEWTRFVSR
jgi:hypothetical protein